MATEFERLKCDIAGHSIMITSWFDDRQQTWRASAPAYAAIVFEQQDGPFTPDSRKAAIDEVVDRLSSHFQSTSRL